ncbi:hypothetical protein GCM10009527_018030 [Actinomadura nitritigenes]
MLPGDERTYGGGGAALRGPCGLYGPGGRFAGETRRERNRSHHRTIIRAGADATGRSGKAPRAKPQGPRTKPPGCGRGRGVRGRKSATAGGDPGIALRPWS